jgi:putative sigma-54 modulation protein
MNLSVTFRHMEATDALKEYARERLERIRKYFPDPITAHVVLATERGFHHDADVMITLHNGIVIKGHESTEDMYSSIDLVMAKIERQLRRYKERIRNHKPHPHAGPLLSVRTSVFTPESVEAPPPPQSAKAAPPAQAAAPQPKIVKSSKFYAKPMTTAEAVMQMNLLENEFLVFMNSSTMTVAVIYRRKDGNIGLIETGDFAAHEVEERAS